MSRTSQLSRSDLVLWPIATEIHVSWHVGNQDKSGLVVLNVSFVARDPTRTSKANELEDNFQPPDAGCPSRPLDILSRRLPID